MPTVLVPRVKFVNTVCLYRYQACRQRQRADRGPGYFRRTRQALKDLALSIYGGVPGDTVRLLVDHLSVAHFAAGPRSQELRCSRGHCACSVVLPDQIACV